VKLSGISKSVNITLGLPIIRTSPAHGTAFEMAGKNMADYRGALLSLEMASRLARRGGSNIVWNF
jgi:4-hydroxythreonine-4-phosphate dehydrogenase